MARRRNGFAKIGILCLVLLAALGVIGTTYSQWVETVYIQGTVEIGTTSSGLGGGACSPSSGDTTISCQASGSTLTVTVNNAQLDVDYSCDFTINNTGSIPVKVQSITITDVPSQVDAWITGVSEGDLIDDGSSKPGKVHVDLPAGGSTSEGTTFTFTVTITTVQWNLYVP